MNPDELMMFLQGASGSSGGASTPSVPAAPAPPMSAPPQLPSSNPDLSGLAQPTGGQVPQLGAPQAPQQQQQRVQGVKGYLSNFLYGVSEAMKAHAGLETDAQRQQREYNNDLNQRKFSLEQANTQAAITEHLARVQQMQSMATIPGPNGPIQVPFALAKPYIDAWGKQQATLTGKRYVVVPNVGVLDTQAPGGPQLAPGTAPKSVTITPQMVTSNGIPEQLVGQTIPVGQFAQLERGGASLAGTISNTTETKELADGTIVQVPKTTTTQKVSPGGTAAAPGIGSSLSPLAPASNNPLAPAVSGSRTTPGKPISMTTKGGVKTLVGPDGQPLRGKGSTQMMVGTDAQGRQIAGTPQEMTAAGVANFTKLDSGEAAKVNTARQMTSPGGLFNLIDNDLARFKPGELEALGPRWNEFLAGTVGTMPTGPDGKQDTRYVALRTHVNGLLSTALMQAHVGARGGERIMEHFEDIANAGKMSLPTLKTALDAERQYVEEKAMRPTAAAPQGNFPPAGAKIRDYTSFK